MRRGCASGVVVAAWVFFAFCAYRAVTGLLMVVVCLSWYHLDFLAFSYVVLKLCRMAWQLGGDTCLEG